MSEEFSAQKVIATWNTARGVWEKPEKNLICEHSALFWEVWPTSGTMQNGLVYELQTPEHHTQDSESSSLHTLPTPAVAHVRNHDEPIEGYLQRRQDFLDGRTKGMPGASLGVAVRMQEQNIEWKLPTPVASEGTKAPSQQDAETKKKTGQVWLSNEAKGLANKNSGWGKFEPAIRRWEAILGRPAPAPTKPDGKDDAHRLNAEFASWMMGLPENWITDPKIGLTRNQALKAAGNGVVPQQAEMALRILLEGFPLPMTPTQTNLPTPTVSDTFTDNLKSTQQKEGSMHSVTLPQAVKWLNTSE